MSDSDYSEITPLLLHQEARETRARDDKSPRVPGRTWLGPDGLLARATALLLMSVVGFGAFFCFDNPGALQDEVKIRGVIKPSRSFTLLGECLSAKIIIKERFGLLEKVLEATLLSLCTVKLQLQQSFNYQLS